MAEGRNNGLRARRLGSSPGTALMGFPLSAHRGAKSMRLGPHSLGSGPLGHFLAAWPQVSCGVFSSINWGGWDHAVSCLTVILGETNDNPSDSAQDVAPGKSSVHILSASASYIEVSQEL